MHPVFWHQLLQSDSNRSVYQKKNSSLLSIPLLIVVLLLLSACGGGGSAPATNQVGASSAEAIRINAGGGDYVDSLGQLWAADTGFNLGDTGIRTDAINRTTDDPLYQTERYHSGWQDTSTPELEYRFSAAAGDYAVKRHFAEIDQYVNRVFDVEIEGQLVLNDFDIISEIGRYSALTKNFVATVTDGEINIRFPRNTQSPKISAIEILPVNNLINTSTTNNDPVGIMIPEVSATTGTLSLTGAPANGTAVINGDNITYTPYAGYSGQDTIIYSFVDAGGTLTISSITVNVDSTGSSTVIANPDNVNVEKDTTVNIPVLVNDSGVSSGSPVVSINGSPANGSVTVLANNTITYTPDASFSGTDSFSYGVTVNSNTSIATVSVNVTCAGCPNDKLIGLSWNPSVSGNDAGYLVYFGTDSNNVDTLLFDLSTATGLVQETPYVEFSTQNDLQLSAGDSVCFRISAYNALQASALSAPICGTI